MHNALWHPTEVSSIYIYIYCKDLGNYLLFSLKPLRVGIQGFLFHVVRVPKIILKKTYRNFGKETYKSDSLPILEVDSVA